ncbi:MAG: hypothetical protein ACHQZR_00430 [Candidatus Limnocylindrales bacterium]
MSGWATPTGSRTWHAYRVDGWSLCRRYWPQPERLYAIPGSPTCRACRKMAALRQATGAVPQGVLDD